jgi:hypothetical protein
MTRSVSRHIMSCHVICSALRKSEYYMFMEGMNRTDQATHHFVVMNVIVSMHQTTLYYVKMV